MNEQNMRRAGSPARRMFSEISRFCLTFPKRIIYNMQADKLHMEICSNRYGEVA